MAVNRQWSARTGIGLSMRRRRRWTGWLAGLALAGAVSNAVAEEKPQVKLTPEQNQQAAHTLMLADSAMRHGQPGNARKLLKEVLEQYPDTGWGRWANLGLGTLEMSRGHLEEARPYFDAANGGFAKDTATTMLGLIDAKLGKTDEALTALEGLANDPSRSDDARQAAALGAAYARLWSGDYEGAAVAFGALADSNHEGKLADDALYGLGRSLIQMGDREAGEEVLRNLSDQPAQGSVPARVRSQLLGLEFRDVLRSTKERYKEVQLGKPEALLGALLDVNGPVLARGALGLPLGSTKDTIPRGPQAAGTSADNPAYKPNTGLFTAGHDPDDPAVAAAVAAAKKQPGPVPMARRASKAGFPEEKKSDGWVLLVLILAGFLIVRRMRRRHLLQER